MLQHIFGISKLCKVAKACWMGSTTDKTAHFSFNDGIHSLPIYEIHVDENLILVLCCGTSHAIIKFIQSMEAQ